MVQNFYNYGRITYITVPEVQIQRYGPKPKLKMSPFIVLKKINQGK